MYSTTTCTALGSWLEQNGHAYTKKNVDADAALMEEFMNVNDGMIGVPFTIIQDENGTETNISGYDRDKFKTILGIH